MTEDGGYGNREWLCPNRVYGRQSSVVSRQASVVSRQSSVVSRQSSLQHHQLCTNLPTFYSQERGGEGRAEAGLGSGGAGIEEKS